MAVVYEASCASFVSCYLHTRKHIIHWNIYVCLSGEHEPMFDEVNPFKFLNYILYWKIENWLLTKRQPWGICSDIYPVHHGIHLWKVLQQKLNCSQINIKYIFIIHSHFYPLVAIYIVCGWAINRSEYFMNVGYNFFSPRIRCSVDSFTLLTAFLASPFLSMNLP